MVEYEDRDQRLLYYRWNGKQQVLTESNNNLFKDNQMADKQSVCVCVCVYVTDEEEPIVISVSV